MNYKRFEYIRIVKTDEDAFMSIVNTFADKGFRLTKWFEDPERNVYRGIMERIKFE